MNCNQFRSELERCVENRTSPNTDVRLHGELCTRLQCRDDWVEFLWLEEAITQWKTKSPSFVPADVAMQEIASNETTARPTTSTSLKAETDDRWGPSGRWRQRQQLREVTAALVSLLAVACVTLAVRTSLKQPDSNNIATTLDSDHSTHGNSDLGTTRLNVPQSNASHLNAPQSNASQLNASHRPDLGTLSLGWIADASIHVSDSVTSVLLGRTQEDSSASPASPWLEIWNGPFKPLEEDLDVLRKLIVDPGDHQTRRHVSGEFWI